MADCQGKCLQENAAALLSIGLTDKEEEQLEDFLIGSASVGYARCWQQVMQQVGEVISRKVLVSNVWVVYKTQELLCAIQSALHSCVLC